ncbi:hypothetical protein VSR69_40870 [Paraburkholderia phytofirmans]
MITGVNDHCLDLSRGKHLSSELLRDVTSDLHMTEHFGGEPEMASVLNALNDMIEATNHGGNTALPGIPPAQMAIGSTQSNLQGHRASGAA